MVWTQVGERVERLRKELGMSRAQFGKLIGVTGQCIGMTERGVCGLSVGSVVKLCHATGVSADYILFGAIDPASDPATTASLRGLSHEQLRIALDIIKKVAEFVNTEDGNEALIQEIASRRRVDTMREGSFKEMVSII